MKDPYETPDVSSCGGCGESSMKDKNSLAFPVEVTVRGGSSSVVDNVSHSAEQEAGPSSPGEESCRRDADENYQYCQQLVQTQVLVDQLTSELNRSRLEVAQLQEHNAFLLKELQASQGHDPASAQTLSLLQTELRWLKGGLFVGVVFLWCGGRKDLLGLVALVWLFVDVIA